MGTSTNPSPRQRLHDVITDLANSGELSLNPTLVMEVKRLCKQSDDNIKCAYEMLTLNLNKDHAQIRLSAVQLTNELFVRSHVFRTLLVNDFQYFIQLAVGIDFNRPLPPPISTRKLLRKTSLLAIKAWYTKYGKDYKKLALGYKYLQDKCTIDFDDVEARDDIERKRENEIETRIQIQKQQRYMETKVDMKGQFSNIKGNINQMNNCFALVFPDMRDESTQSNEADNSNENDNDRVDTNRRHGLVTTSYKLDVRLGEGITIEVTEGNAGVINTLLELHRLNKNTYIPLVNRWLDALIQVKDDEESAEIANLIRECIDLKADLDNVCKKFNLLHFDSAAVDRILRQDTGRGVDFEIHIERERDGHKYQSYERDNLENESDDDDMMEEVRKEGYEPCIEIDQERQRRKHRKSGKEEREKDSVRVPGGWSLSSYTDQLSTRGANMTDPTVLINRKYPTYDRETNQNVGHKEEGKDDWTETNRLTTIEDPKFEERLKRAPVVSYDTDLDYWDKKSVPAVNNGMDDLHHRFWPGSEGDKGIDIKQFRTRVVRYDSEFQPVIWACRTPLPSGSLCTRRDREKCPFHGLITARDRYGVPNGKEAIRFNLEEKEKEKEKETEKEKEQVPLWLEVAEDMGLGIVDYYKRANKEEAVKPKKNSKKPKSNLIDTEKEKNTPRSRLRKRLSNKKDMQRLAHQLNAEEHKRHSDKFGNQWQYY